ncbi:MAG: hypothetical protein NTY53_24735 [Kiritimatiellaeota bacterium]|nr:hypothetical protein [Kiritimatiellota bacterium]
MATEAQLAVWQSLSPEERKRRAAILAAANAVPQAGEAITLRKPSGTAPEPVAAPATPPPPEAQGLMRRAAGVAKDWGGAAVDFVKAIPKVASAVVSDLGDLPSDLGTLAGNGPQKNVAINPATGLPFGQVEAPSPLRQGRVTINPPNNDTPLPASPTVGARVIDTQADPMPIALSTNPMRKVTVENQMVLTPPSKPVLDTKTGQPIALPAVQAPLTLTAPGRPALAINPPAPPVAAPLPAGVQLPRLNRGPAQNIALETSGVMTKPMPVATPSASVAAQASAPGAGAVMRKNPTVAANDWRAEAQQRLDLRAKAAADQADANSILRNQTAGLEYFAPKSYGGQAIMRKRTSDQQEQARQDALQLTRDQMASTERNVAAQAAGMAAAGAAKGTPFKPIKADEQVFNEATGQVVDRNAESQREADLNYINSLQPGKTVVPRGFGSTNDSFDPAKHLLRVDNSTGQLTVIHPNWEANRYTDKKTGAQVPQYSFPSAEMQQAYAQLGKPGGTRTATALPPKMGAPAAGTDLPTPKTPAEATKLPKGTRYRDPMGNIRVV